MKAGVSLVALAANIAPSTTPLFLVDTCSVLDIIRAGYRKDASPLIVSAANAILSAASSVPRKVWVIVMEQVGVEWNRHRIQVTAELQNSIEGTENLTQRFHSAARVVAPQIMLSFSPLTDQQIGNSLMTLGQDFLNAAEVLNMDKAIGEKAFNRTLSRQAPARNGGSVEDCAIIEHYMELVRQLRARSYSELCIFISSNTNDFGSVGNPYAPLDGEFAALGIEYVKDLSRARTRLNQIAQSQII